MPHSPGHCVVALATQSDRLALAERIARDCGAPLVDIAQMPENTGLALIVRDRDITLHTADALDRGGVGVDLLGAFNRPDRARLTRRQPFARAIGPPRQFIIDATAGLGADSAMLAAYGCRVLAAERSPVLAALLIDAWQHAVADPARGTVIADRLEFVHGDARDVLRSADPPPDVVYIDPMFPPKRRGSALPPKAAQVLRLLVGNDTDAADLLVAARAVARSRVVVKRPDHAPPLADPVDAQYKGKLVRYDVYVTRPEAR